MQEKIEEIIRERLFLWNEPDDPKEWILDGFNGAATEITKLITAEIAKLFERKVIWEGEAMLQHWTSNGVRLTAIATEIGGGNLLGEIGSDYQRVRVIVEDIDDKKPTD